MIAGAMQAFAATGKGEVAEPAGVTPCSRVLGEAGACQGLEAYTVSNALANWAAKIPPN